MKILGINGNCVDKTGQVNESSAALIVDGKLVAAVAEERISRIKVDGKFPLDAIQEVLKIGKCTIEDIDYLAVGGLHPTNNARAYLKSCFSTYFDTGILLTEKVKKFGWAYLYNLIKTPKVISTNILAKDFNIQFMDHHYCHAAGAYYCSPFSEALVITLDGGGDGLDGGAYLGKNNLLERFMEIPHFQSPGTMYSAITHDLGFKRHKHEGKITGLAAFGNPDPKRMGLSDLLKYSASKHRFISKEIAKHHRSLHSKSTYFYPLLEKFSKEDLAAVTQHIFEESVLSFISDAYERAKKKGYVFTKICLAGGCFANVKLNQKIYELGHFNDLFVYPAMGDDGISVGAAMMLYYKENKTADKSLSAIKDTYAGGSFSDSEIEQALKQFNLPYTYYEEVEEIIAQHLAEGKVVARFNGRMEYGPRALGNRSVIAFVHDKSINDWLNKKFNRTEFMPFAPSMLEEFANEYLDNYHGECAADYMTITYTIKKGKAQKIPAVVHVDNTARPQIVKKETNPSYHKIISAYHKKTGIPVVLNTSFNMHEEPIVYTPTDAVRGFLDAKLDVLAIGNYLYINK